MLFQGCNLIQQDKMLFKGCNLILPDIYQAIEIFAFVSTTILLLMCFNYKIGLLCNYV